MVLFRYSVLCWYLSIHIFYLYRSYAVLQGDVEDNADEIDRPQDQKPVFAHSRARGSSTHATELHQGIVQYRIYPSNLTYATADDEDEADADSDDEEDEEALTDWNLREYLIIHFVLDNTLCEWIT